MVAPMNDLDPTPSSIRDDSICESSLNPNKSSGDIGERTWTPEQFWEFAAAFLGDHEATTSRTMIEDRGLVLIPAAEIERLRRENETSEKFKVGLRELLGTPPDGSIVQSLMELATKLRTAESAVAAAWEEAAKIAEAMPWFVKTSRKHVRGIKGSDVASAIRAAVSKKTAESGHSPSTHNSESE